MKSHQRKLAIGSVFALSVPVLILTGYFPKHSLQSQGSYGQIPLSILENSDKFTLYSLDGGIICIDDNCPPTHGNFHGMGIRGQKIITDPKQRSRLVNAFEGALNPDAPQYSCFNPEHGLRAEAGGHVLDIVVCFHCGNFIVFENGQKLYPNRYRIPISKDGLAVFQKAVIDAGLPHG